MTREHHHHAEPGKGAHATAASHDAGPGPGKRTLAEDANGDATASAARHESELHRLRKEAHAAYLGGEGFEKRGVLDHQLDAINDMKDYLNKDDPPSFGAKVLQAAIQVSVAAAAGALAVAAGEVVVAAALVAGGGAAAAALPGVFASGPDGSVDPIKFCSDYGTAVRVSSGKAAHKLHTDMNTVAKARSAHARMLALVAAPDAIKQVQKNLVLDAWVNALKVKHQGGKASDMGKANFGDSTKGRLHIQGIRVDPGAKPGTQIGFQGLEAKLTGVPQAPRQFDLNRKIEDIGVSRTIEGNVLAPPGGRSVPPTQFAFGIRPDKTPDYRGGEVSVIAEGQLAKLDGASSWQDGLGLIWHKMRGFTLASLGVRNISN